MTEDSGREDLKDTQYIDVVWLQTCGLHKLNVLVYFYTSPFFDKNSNNQILRNQGVGLEFLPQMTGIEFSLNESSSNQGAADPRLYVVKKLKRFNSQRIDLLEVYYILDGIIYQSPIFIDQVRARVAKASNHLLQCFQEIQDDLHTDGVNISGGDYDSSSVSKAHTINEYDDIDNDGSRLVKTALPSFTNTLDKLAYFN